MKQRQSHNQVRKKLANKWHLAALLGLLCFSSIGASAAPVALDHVSVIVNDGVILQSDINAALTLIRHDAKQKQQPLPEPSALKKQVLDKLIVDEIQYQQAIRIGVRIDDNRLDEAINKMAKEQSQTLEQLRNALLTQNIQYAAYREQIRREMTIAEARNAIVRRRINILPAEVEMLANQLSEQTNESVQYKIEHIQLAIEEGQDRASQTKQAEALIERLNQGEGFASMAMTYSKGPKALQGGDWGWMRKEEMPTIFADQITTQAKGAVIGPFLSGVGLHILKIADTKGLDTIAVTEVNARHILIKPSVILSDEGAERLLRTYTNQINAGESTFAKLAAQFSQDPTSAAQDGELGYQTPDLYVPEFKHQVESLPIGEISQPFQTVHGWHIVEVLDRREVDKTDAALKNRAYRILFNRKFNEEASAWIQEIRAGAFIEYLDRDDLES